MNLEDIEQKCFNFLQQSSNPLVPLTTLLRHLWQDEACGELSEPELLSFLRNHELFRVVELEETDPTLIEDMTEAGIPLGPRVVLKSRIPAKAELSEMIQEQLAAMMQALGKALQEARQQGDEAAQAQIEEVLERTQNLFTEIAKAAQ